MGAGAENVGERLSGGRADAGARRLSSQESRTHPPVAWFCGAFDRASGGKRGAIGWSPLRFFSGPASTSLDHERGSVGKWFVLGQSRSALRRQRNLDDCQSLEREFQAPSARGANTARTRGRPPTNYHRALLLEQDHVHPTKDDHSMCAPICPPRQSAPQIRRALCYLKIPGFPAAKIPQTLRL